MTYCYENKWLKQTKHADQGYQKNRPLQQLFKVFNVFILRLLHVSALGGHHQAKHTM
jgi:hypothetical protein